MTTLRTTKPGAGDKYFIRKASGGYSSCIQGSPTDANCDVLANCVGFACGFLNEQGQLGYEKYYLNCNAENFIERAISLGLSVVKEPVVGGIMVWQYGATLSGSDGAGHVAGVYAKPNNDTVRTAESGYGSSAFWTATRSRGNGNWGAGAGYTYRGCIVSPYYKEEPTPTPSGDFDRYIVVSGDTLGGIANKFNTTIEYLMQINSIITDRNLIIVGWVLNIPKQNKPTPAPKPLLPLDEIAREVRAGKYGNYPERKTKLEAEGYNYSEVQNRVDAIINAESQRTHTVSAGENLSFIARQYNTTWQKIYNDNKAVIGENPNHIFPGQVLIIK